MMTAFQRRVYDETRKIPRGRVISYGELARRIGCGSARAVGQALRVNPLVPQVPCHRVVAADGSLGGFFGRRDAAALAEKRRRLEREGVRFLADGRVKMAVACAVALALGGLFARDMAYDTLIAHRGECFDAPENTLPAYKLAVERGFGFECDVYLSADGCVFTFHDGNLKSVTGGKNAKKCSEARWDTEIAQLDIGSWGRWKGSKFAGTHPARLEDVCALARDGRFIFCEVKGDSANVVAPIRRILENQAKATPKNFRFISFDRGICAELKRQMPRYKTYWLTGCNNMPVETLLTRLRETGADGVDICFSAEIHTAAFIEAIHRAGYEFHVWTVDDPETAALAFARGVDTLTTNRAKHLLDSRVDTCP